MPPDLPLPLVSIAIVIGLGTVAGMDAAEETGKTRVLLTGASGLGGSHALKYLLAATDWEFVCPITFAHHGLPDRLVFAVQSAANNLQEEERTVWERVHILKRDLSTLIDELTIRQLGRIAYIISYAAESDVGRSIDNPVPFVKNNVDIALHLLELARVLKPRAFVLVSTDEVHGSVPHGEVAAHDEWSPVIPSNPYAASKAAQEAIAISYWRTFRVPVIIVNCMNLIGETQDSEKLVPLIISKVVAGETVPIHASVGQDGARTPSRSYLHAQNLADAILFLLRRGRQSISTPDKADRPDRWNIPGLHELNNLSMAHRIAELIGKPLRYEFVDVDAARPGHDERYALNGTKITAAGWIAQIPFDESLRRVVEWTIERPLWAHGMGRRADPDGGAPVGPCSPKGHQKKFSTSKRINTEF